MEAFIHGLLLELPTLASHFRACHLATPPPHQLFSLTIHRKRYYVKR